MLSINYNTVLVSVPKRKYLYNTLTKLDEENISYNIFFDNGFGIVQNHINALKYGLKDNSDFVLLLQDDIIINKNFKSAIAQSVLQNYKVISFYSNIKKVGEALKNNKPFAIIHGRDFLNCQAILIKSSIVKDFLQAYDNNMIPQPPTVTFDGLLRRFFAKEKINVCLTAPSLVQHVGKESLLGHPWKCGKLVRESRTFNNNYDCLDWVRLFGN